MKKLNKKGFTLMELLAVIIILAVIMFIAVPSVARIIEGAKRDAYVQTGKQFVSAVRNSAIQGDYKMPSSAGEVTLVSIELVDLESGGERSTYDSPWDYGSSYVAIKADTKEDGTLKYVYMFAGLDAEGHFINLTDEKVLNDTYVNKGTQSITSIPDTCTKTGTTLTNTTISGITGEKTVTAYCNK